MALKIVFMGTPDFAVPALEELIRDYGVLAVFTKPDKPKGRGQKLQTTPVKELAQQNGIPVYQPQRLRNNLECESLLKSLEPDLIIVIAYGQILPVEILKIPRLGCVNLHASLLPRLRGAAPINWSIIRGDTETGNTTQLMEAGIDTGDILLQSKLFIGEHETAGELYDRLSVDGVQLLRRTIEGLKSGTILPIKQDDALSTHAPMMDKQLGRLDFTQSNKTIDCLIRGVTPWPGATCEYNGKMLKLLKVSVNSEELEAGTVTKAGQPGEIMKVHKKGIVIQCGEGTLTIEELQEIGGKKMDVASYLNGHTIVEGELFQ